MINVTKAYLPNREKFDKYVDQIFSSAWLTNNGPLVQLLEQRLAEYLSVKHVVLVANGSIALQLAYKVLQLKGDVITTPFSFAATTSTLAWEGLKPVFADINPKTFNICPLNIERAIGESTSAVVPVHVFGNSCPVAEIEDIARRYKLHVVYDAAHAFGVNYKGRSVLSYGDISTLSFHATKIFHCIEGGAIITDSAGIVQDIRKMMNFGIVNPNKIDGVGTNAKMNEFEAAMGLCVLDEIETIERRRAELSDVYVNELKGLVQFQQLEEGSSHNASYMPILLESETELLGLVSLLNKYKITPRRYFYPSLDTLEYLQSDSICPVSRDISSRILCLPIYPDLQEQEQKQIIDIIRLFKSTQN